MVELKDPQQQEKEGKLQCHSCLTLSECTFATYMFICRELTVVSHGCCFLPPSWQHFM